MPTGSAATRGSCPDASSNGRVRTAATNWRPQEAFPDRVALRSSRRSVSQANEPEHRITFTAREETACGASNEKKNRSPPSWTVSIRRPRGQPATQWRGVSATTEGRRECLSPNTVTGRTGHGPHQPFRASIGSCHVSDSCGVAATYSVVGINHSAMVGGSIVMARYVPSGGRCEAAVGIGWRHCQCKCVDQTLQLVEARRERLQRGCNVCVQTVGCNVRGCLRHLHLCGFLLRFLGGGAGAATCLGAQGCRSGRERSEDPKVPGRSGDAGQFWWSFAATLCVLPSSLSIPSRRRRHRSSRSAICSTAAPGSRPSSCPRHR